MCVVSVYARQAVVCAAETLSFMAAASLDEDEHGVVQHTLPVVLASLLVCLLSVEAYTKSPAYRGGRHTPSHLEAPGATRPQPAAACLCMENCVMRIVDAFGHHLSAVPLPPLLKQRLESLLLTHPDHTAAWW